MEGLEEEEKEGCKVACFWKTEVTRSRPFRQEKQEMKARSTEEREEGRKESKGAQFQTSKLWPRSINLSFL